MPSRAASSCVRPGFSLRLLPIFIGVMTGPLVAQGPDSAAHSTTSSPAHPTVCANGVRRYASLGDVPVPFDTLTMPRNAPPIRVTSPEQEAAAERQIAERAGSVGATGMVLADDVQDEGAGRRRVSRHVTPVFVSADSGRAQIACHGNGPTSAAPDRPGGR